MLPEGASADVTGGESAAVTGEAREDVAGGGGRWRYRRRKALASSEGRAQGLREGVGADTTG